VESAIATFKSGALTSKVFFESKEGVYYFNVYRNGEILEGGTDYFNTKKKAEATAMARSALNQFKNIKEEVEQIDEISKEKLGNYVNKAIESVRGNTMKAGGEARKGNLVGFEKYTIKALERQSNIKKAVKKL